jgi:hypothetical protein
MRLVCVRVYLCVCLYMYTCTCIYIHIYIHINVYAYAYLSNKRVEGGDTQSHSAVTQVGVQHFAAGHADVLLCVCVCVYMYIGK